MYKATVCISDTDLLALMKKIDPNTPHIPIGVHLIAQAVIDHVSPQIEREAYERVAMLVKIKRAGCVTNSQMDELDALLAAIRALAEGKK